MRNCCHMTIECNPEVSCVDKIDRPCASPTAQRETERAGEKETEKKRDRANESYGKRELSEISHNQPPRFE